MTHATRARLKYNAIIPSLERPLFDKPFIMSRSRRIDTSGDTWQIGEAVPLVLKWTSLIRFPEQLVSQVKYAFEFYLLKLAPNSVGRIFEILKNFSHSIDEWEDDECLASQLSEYIFDFIVANRKRYDENNLSELRRWYVRSYHLGLSLFQRQTCQVLANLVFRGSQKGLDVLVYIDGRSPLRADELSRLRKALTDCRSRITSTHPIFPKLVATWLFVVLGVRPRQLLLLMVCDFSVNVDPNTGNKTYMLNVPSVKKRYTLPRTHFKSRLLPIFLGEMIEQLLTVNYGAQFSVKLASDSDARPLFIRSHYREWQKQHATFERYENAELPVFFSSAPRDVVAFINEWLIGKGQSALNLELTPRRLRKTFATHAAAMGATAIALMELLDHADLQYVMVYYQLGVTFALRVDEVYQKQFRDHLDFFAGKITLKDLVKKNDLHAVFGPDSLRKLVGIGSCAKGSPCALQPPYSCYGCAKFEASNDVTVHQEVLQAMQSEVREKFGDDAPPGFYTASHIKACSELVNRLEVENE